jgi:hypothetical protein
MQLIAVEPPSLRITLRVVREPIKFLGICFLTSFSGNLLQVFSDKLVYACAHCFRIAGRHDVTESSPEQVNRQKFDTFPLLT